MERWDKDSGLIMLAQLHLRVLVLCRRGEVLSDLATKNVKV